jgi:hypothetical protein
MGRRDWKSVQLFEFKYRVTHSDDLELKEKFGIPGYRSSYKY